MDVSGLLVTPGLVDLHTHVFNGQDLGLRPDAIGPPSGTTTLIDTGSAGGHLFDAFRASSIDRSEVRVRAFVNVSSIGTTSILLSGELKTLAYVDEEVAVACIEGNRDVVVGVKVRASHDVGGPNAPEALRRARRVADRVGLPLMVHLGPPPVTVDEIADYLGAGDVLTHCFTGFAGNQVVQDGTIRRSVLAARARGARFDVGHGISGFSAAVARTAIEQGFLPDTVSTDLHSYSARLVIDLPQVLSKLVALGMSLQQVLTAATIAPAKVVGLDTQGIGTLRPGAPADVAVFRIEEGPVEFLDGCEQSFTGGLRLVPVLTVLGGRVVFDQLADRAVRR